MKIRETILSLIGCLCVLAGSSLSAFAAGKTWITTDEINYETSGAYILSGYVEDYAVMENGSILGVFRSPGAKKPIRFFLDLSDGSGRKKDSAEVVKHYCGTINKVLLEGLIKNHDGKMEVSAFCLALDL